jgi:hypothetical protein
VCAARCCMSQLCNISVQIYVHLYCTVPFLPSLSICLTMSNTLPRHLLWYDPSPPNMFLSTVYSHLPASYLIFMFNIFQPIYCLALFLSFYSFMPSTYIVHISFKFFGQTIGTGSGWYAELLISKTVTINSSFGDPDPYVFGPPESGSVSTRYGSGSRSSSASGSGSFYHQAKK